MSSPDLRSSWLASTIVKHSEVTGARTLPDGLVEVERKNLPSITVAPLGNLRIDSRLVESVLRASPPPTVIVLVPRAGHYEWEARALAMAQGSTIFTVKELYTFMRERDPRAFVDKNVDYNRARLAQHSRVAKCEMICEASARLRRRDSLGDVVVAMEYEYEFTEEAVVRAIERHPDVDVILNANPSGRVTAAAYAHAIEARVPVYKIGELMGALNYDGEQFRNYEPAK
jgi:hypothetical protein